METVGDGEIGREGLLEHVQIDVGGALRRGRVDGEPEGRAGGAGRRVAAHPLEPQIEGGCRGPELDLGAPAARGRDHRDGEGQPAQRRSLGHPPFIGPHEGERDTVDPRFAEGRGRRRPRRRQVRDRHGRLRRRLRAGLRQRVEGRASVLVHDHRQCDPRHLDRLDRRAMAQKRPWRPASVDAIDGHEIRRERLDLLRRPHDEALDRGAREQGHAGAAIVDFDPGRRARERLNAALEPGLVEAVDQDQQRDHEGPGEPGKAQGQADGPATQGATSPRCVAGDVAPGEAVDVHERTPAGSSLRVVRSFSSIPTNR